MKKLFAMMTVASVTAVSLCACAEPKSVDDVQVESVSGSVLSEVGAMALTDEFISCLAQGDLAGALALTGREIDIPSDLDGASDTMAAYFSNLDYELNIAEVNDNTIVVSVDGTAADLEASLAEMLSDVDLMAPYYADYIEADLRGDDAAQNTYSIINEIYATAIDNAPRIDYSRTVTVGLNEAGDELVIASASGFLTDIAVPMECDEEANMIAGADLLLEQGRITQQEYDDLMSEIR